MELIRDYLQFNCQSANEKLGYSLNEAGISNGPIFNFFGYDIVGVYLKSGKLTIEFDKEINSIGFGLKIGSKPNTPTSTTDTAICKVEEIKGGLPFERVQIYKVTEGELELSNLKKDQFSTAWLKASVSPLYDRGVRSNDSFYYYDSENLHQKLELSAENLILQSGEKYIVALKPSGNILKESYGIAEVTPIDNDETFLVKDMRTDIRTATLCIGADNEIKVRVFYKNIGLSVLNFDRYELHGVTEEPLDTSVDDSFLKYGKIQGEFVLDLSNIIQVPGIYETSLIGYSTDEPEGVVIWNPGIIKSRLNITAVAT